METVVRKGYFLFVQYKILKALKNLQYSNHKIHWSCKIFLIPSCNYISLNVLKKVLNVMYYVLLKIVNENNVT